MSWLLASPGHQQPWYWWCRMGRFLSYWGRVSTTCVISMWSNDIKCKYMFMFPLQNLARKELMLCFPFQVITPDSVCLSISDGSMLPLMAAQLGAKKVSTLEQKYHQTSKERHTLVDNKIVDHSDVVGASPVGAAPTTSSFWTQHLASMDWAKITARRGKKHLNFGFGCDLY